MNRMIFFVILFVFIAHTVCAMPIQLALCFNANNLTFEDHAYYFIFETKNIAGFTYILFIWMAVFSAVVIGYMHTIIKTK